MQGQWPNAARLQERRAIGVPTLPGVENVTPPLNKFPPCGEEMPVSSDAARGNLAERYGPSCEGGQQMGEWLALAQHVRGGGGFPEVGR